MREAASGHANDFAIDELVPRFSSPLQ
jgi:hypothetical protein